MSAVSIIWNVTSLGVDYIVGSTEAETWKIQTLSAIVRLDNILLSWGHQRDMLVKI